MSDMQQIGFAAEELACRFLQKQGLRLISRNYRCKTGEIDLIMQENLILVFVEVRFRKNEFFGTSAETVTYTKQKKLIKAAQFYLQQHRCENRPCRFDVIAMTSRNSKSEIEWIKDAFST